MKAFKLLAVALAATPLIASAGTLTLDLNTVFTGGLPGGSNPLVTPWLRATFDDTADSIGANGVRLTLTALNLTPTEFVSDWVFNLNTTKSAAALGFTIIPTNPTGLLQPNTNQYGIFAANNAQDNQLGAAGLKDFDIAFEFPVSNGSGRLTAGDSFVVDISYTSALGAADFDFQNAPNGVAYSAAHVQGIFPNDDSSKIFANLSDGGGGGGSIPEPSTYAAFAGLAALVLGVWRHRRTL